MDNLRAQALQAREAGEHERAIGHWRTLLAQHPDDWRLALELKRDLKAAWHYPESDPQFRRAARALPDRDWLAHYAALYAYHGGDLETLDVRARAMLERMPDDHRVWAILGDVASQRRDWAGAETAFAAAHAAEPREDYEYKREMAAMYRRVGPALRGPGGETSPHGFGIAFINLDRNPEREAELRRQFSGCAPPLHRLAGIEGRR